ncbi:MAG: hypothetical protein AAF939_09775 [Planctomycetota bacterium]
MPEKGNSFENMPEKEQTKALEQIASKLIQQGILEDNNDFDIENQISPEILAMMQKVDSIHDSAILIPVRDTDTPNRNPLKRLLTGETGVVWADVEGPDGKLDATMIVQTKNSLPDDAESSSKETENPVALGAKGITAIEPESGFGDETEFLSPEKDSEDLFQLNLAIANWPENWQLLNAPVLEADSEEPVAIFTCHPIDAGKFQLTLDFGDPETLGHESLRLHLKVACDGGAQ